LEAAHTAPRQAETTSTDAPIDAESIVETVRESLLILGANLRIIASNPAFYRTFQTTPQETEHRLLYELGNGQWDIPGLRELLEQLLPQRRTFDDFEVTQTFPHLGQQTMLLNARQIMRQSQGTPLILLALEDITLRKRAEEALRQQRDWFEVMLSSIGDAVIVTDTNSAITFINPVAERLTGWGAQEPLGHPIDAVFRIIHEYTRQPIESPVTRVLREGTVVGLANPTVLITRHGSEVPIADSAAPIHSSGGTIQGVVLIFRDISERIRMEKELFRARKIDSVGVLAGGIAHDFNNLLTVLLGNISLARMFAGLDEKVTARLVEAEKAGQRATALTHQLLTFSKGGAPVRCTVSITELLKESTSFVLHGSTVRCNLLIPEDLWPVDVDAGQINQVLHNVVLNAIQAMPDGGSVQVQVEHILVSPGGPLSLQKGRYLKVSVQDHGCGIPQDVLPNIFDPYFTTKEHGSGLGLATAYAIIIKHEGYMIAESAVGAGTTISIYLPASQHTLVTTQDATETPRIGSGRILVMDDEDAIRDLLSDMLTSLGYEAACVRDGAEAMALYQSARAAGQPFAVVILDATIPGGMGGRETLERLRALDPQVKAVISSGYANDPVMASFAQYGFSGVLAKPYTVAGLSDVLQCLVGPTALRLR
jgi:two-component system cell cycle sensor histidine kinase/response regulator CckA